MKFGTRWLVTAVAVAVAVWIVPGVSILSPSAWVGVALLGLVLAFVNIGVKPFVQMLSLPITVLTMGIFYLIVNTALLYFAGWLANGLFDIGFVITNWFSGFFAAIVISVVSTVVNGWIAD